MGVVDRTRVLTPYLHYLKFSASLVKQIRFLWMRRRRLTVRPTSRKWLSRNADQCCLSLMALTPTAFCREYSPDPSGIAFAYARVSTLSLEGHRALAVFLHVTTELSQGRESWGRLAPVGPSSVSVAFLQGLARGELPNGRVVG